MSFGFSVSDIIKVSQICWKTWQACTSGRKAAPGEFTEVEGDIFTLSTALENLAAALASEAQEQTGVVERVQSLEAPITQCRNTIQELNTFLDKHRPSLGSSTEHSTWPSKARKNWRKIIWVTHKDTVNGIRSRISKHVEALNTLIAISERWSLPKTFEFSKQALTVCRSVVRRVEEKVDEINRRLEQTNSSSHENDDDVRINLAPTSWHSNEPVQDVEDFDRDGAMRELRLWLQPAAEVEEERTIQGCRQWPSTCGWIVHKQAYMQWASARNSSILWFHARPGAGKSILASYLIRLYEESTEVASYFCFRYNFAVLRTPQSLLRSLAFQMAERNSSLCKDLVRLCEQGFKVSDAKSAVIWKKIFVDILLKARLQKPVYWIIDALDECDVVERLPFLNFLVDIPRSPTCFKVLIFSRYARDIATKLQQLPVPTEEITPGDNAADIELFARERLERSPALKSLISQILPQIVEQSNGSFLWVSKTLDTLDNIESVDEIVQALKELPPGMDELYKMILQAMAQNTKSQVELAKTILRWVLCVSRPLSLVEIDYVLEILHGSVVDTETTIKNLCGQLLNIDRNQRVQINHMTLQEYFNMYGKSEPTFSINFPDAHAELASFCLGYFTTLENVDEMSGKELKVAFPLAEYVSMYWSYHVGLSQQPTNLAQQIIDFLISSTFNKWLQILALCSSLEYLSIALEVIKKWASLFDSSDLTTYTEGLESLCEQLGYSNNSYHGARIGRMKHGFGINEYANGDQYEGSWENDFRHGFGECVYADGAKYTGWWMRDEYSGQGTLTSADGSQYVGNWEAGRKSGYGAMTWTWMERFNYQGSWKDDRPHGLGTMIFCFGTRYEGEWANGCEHGSGNMVYWNGNHFRGQFVNGDEVGDIIRGQPLPAEGTQPGSTQGVLRYASGGTYEGELSTSGIPHGAGAWNAPTGYVWKGTFTEGLFDGQGILYRLHGGFMRGVWHKQVANGKFEDVNDTPGGGRYFGDFQDTTRHGDGILESASGYVYEGSFSKNEMHGYGERRYHNGDRYVGQSAHGSMHGKGRMVYASLAVYDGEWSNNKRHGLGSLELSQGHKFTGHWSNDRAVGGAFAFF